MKAQLQNTLAAEIPDPEKVKAELQRNLVERRLLRKLYRLALAREAETARLQNVTEGRGHGV